ncbi:hypothetical protein F0562_026664 [Nyssa sinensis]|uniref:Protein SGT1 homolog n=1 Tax=Nyssa sinensis TaxID=561372 RepID=A0A5J5BDK4_9ASTE|nr:hypothetical protein F0562_026664 [Nyssa sinensis]
MASDFETRAKEAFIDDHFELAVDLYSQAITMNPKNAELFADRAQANIKLNSFTEAVSDANRAIELDPSLAKAYLRKGTACMKLEEYQTAKAALETGASLALGDSRFTNLIKECEELIAEEAGELPKQSLDEAQANVVISPASQSSDETVVAAKDAQPVNDSSSQVTIVARTKPKYRHEFYQKPEEVVVTIFAKGVPAENVVVDFGEQIVSITIDIPGEDVYTFQPRLFGKIIPAKCKYEILSTKIEICLAKAEAIQWTSLEFSKEATVAQRIIVPSGTQRPTYPSSKPNTRDWDKLEAEVKKEEKEEKLDGDAALNKFFRDIYQDADEDTRRAMRKSFVESNGTVLSTNWKEVGSKKEKIFTNKVQLKFCKLLGFFSFYVDSVPAINPNRLDASLLYCLIHKLAEWNRPLKTLNAQQDHKLMFGLLFSLKSLTAKMDPTSVEKGNLGVPQLPGQGCSFHSFCTNTYKLSFMESPSGIKIILVTHPRTGDLRESLKFIYNLYVEYVARNPLYAPGTPIRCELFNTTLDQYVRGLG